MTRNCKFAPGPPSKKGGFGSVEYIKHLSIVFGNSDRFLISSSTKRTEIVSVCCPYDKPFNS